MLAVSLVSGLPPFSRPGWGCVENLPLCAPMFVTNVVRVPTGEDALANISIEKDEHGAIQGFVRIRCKTQGIALGLGDKITAIQRFSS